jgi:choline-sulfatase
VYSEYNLANHRAKYMIRRGDFKYNFYKSDTPELYDLRKDPSEMRNLAGLPAYAAKLDHMKGQLFAWHHSA